MPEGRIFVDTNILIYAYDKSAAHKRDIARRRVTDLWESGQGVLSTQVLQEFFVTATRKIEKPLPIDVARGIVSDLLHWHVIVNGGEDILDGISLHMKHSLSLWGAMIVQAAIKGKCTTLLSEDLAHDQTIAGVTIRNPFLEADSQ
jgi:predicted nucleic acid-binding protein